MKSALLSLTLLLATILPFNAIEGPAVALAAPQSVPDRGRPVAVAYYPINDQLEAYWIDDSGALNVRWKAHNGDWGGPRTLSGPGFARPGAALSAVYQPVGQQMEVYAIGPDGSVRVMWKGNNKPDWGGPRTLTQPGVAVPASALSAVYQPIGEQLEVYWVDAGGMLNVIWKAHNGQDWSGPRRLGAPHFALPGAPLSVVYQPVGEQLEVYAIGADGSIRVMWKAHNGQDWGGPRVLTQPGAAPVGARLSTVYQPIGEQLEVYWIDGGGALNATWKAHNGQDWGVRRLSTPGLAPAGAPLVAIYQPVGEQLEVYTIGANGSIQVMWKAHNGQDWGGPRTLSNPGLAPLGSPITAAFDPDQYNQLEVYFVDVSGVLDVMWKGNNGQKWDGPNPLAWNMFMPHLSVAPTDPHLADVGRCTRFMKNVVVRMGGELYGDEQEAMWTHCTDILGITKYCADHGGYPNVTQDNAITGDPTGNKFGLTCTPYATDDANVFDQTLHIIRGVGEGLDDALVAAAPFLPVVTQGAGCLSGVVFACATLALDVADAAGASIPGVVPEMVGAASDASDCANGSVVACVKLGGRGAKAAHIEPIPGVDYSEVAQDAQKCGTDDAGILACLHLGKVASQAAGLPGGPATLPELDGCYNGDVGACADLGRTVAGVTGLPLKDLSEVADNASKCRGGDAGTPVSDRTEACSSLGRDVVTALKGQ